MKKDKLLQQIEEFKRLNELTQEYIEELREELKELKDDFDTERRQNHCSHLDFIEQKCAWCDKRIREKPDLWEKLWPHTTWLWLIPILTFITLYILSRIF